MKIGLVAPCSNCSPLLLELGASVLSEKGFQVVTHPQAKKRHLFFAGTHEDRARAFFEFAKDPTIDVIWAVRGGYGANHLLPRLREMAFSQGKPSKKLLVGYSDVTALHEMVRSEWGWSTLHASMAAEKSFFALTALEKMSLWAWVRGEKAPTPWEKKSLKFIGAPPTRSIRGEMIGGNLSVWCSLLGTSFQPKTKDKILFFEDIAESWSRVDRMVSQLALSGALLRVQAIVLGNFLDCKDRAPEMIDEGMRKKHSKEQLLTMLQKGSKLLKTAPIRPVVSDTTAFHEIFGKLSSELGIPVAYGLPAGHGPGHAPLPLGAQYELRTSGQLEMTQWKWLSPS